MVGRQVRFGCALRLPSRPGCGCRGSRRAFSDLGNRAPESNLMNDLPATNSTTRPYRGRRRLTGALQWRHPLRRSCSRSAVLSTNSSSRLQPPSAPACRDYLFPKRANGVNPLCPTGVSVNTCSRRRAPSGIRSLPAWAFPSSRPSSRTGGRPRPSSWSPPRCAFPSCCNGGGDSRLQPIAMKQHCSTQPSTRWTQPSMSSSSEMIPAAQLIEPPITHPRTRSIPTVLVRAPAI